MKKVLTIILLLTCMGLTSWGQKGLEGHWIGTITQGTEEFRFELYLKRSNRNQLEARTFVHLSDSTYVEMAANGVIHSDWSINLYDFELIRPEKSNEEIHFIRTYQLLFRREFNEYFIKGWWQEKEVSTMDPQRRNGYIFLEKSTLHKA